MTVCFLRIGAEFLEDAKRYSSMARAVEAYRAYAHECMRFGNTPDEATLHLARSKDELHEYPDWALSVGTRGGVRKARC